MLTTVSKEETKRIYKSYMSKNMSRRELSKRYNIPENVISDILKAGSYAVIYYSNNK